MIGTICILYYKRTLVLLFIKTNFHIHLVISLADSKWQVVFGFVIVVCLFFILVVFFYAKLLIRCHGQEYTCRWPWYMKETESLHTEPIMKEKQNCTNKTDHLARGTTLN